MGLDPALAAVRRAVADQLIADPFATDLADAPAGAPLASTGTRCDEPLILVACSGGPDSLALAAAVGWLCAAPHRLAGRRLRAGAVIVDHGWFPDSTQVALDAAATCRALGLDPVEVIAVQVPDSPDGPEAAARSARYAALDGAAERLGAAAILLGHTLDDQAETVLLGLARGSGPRSLAGMPAQRGVYRRPLLGLRRVDTVQACRSLGLSPWADPANADPRYARSRLRSAMAVLEEAIGPGIAPALARTAQLVAEDAQVLDQLAQDALFAVLVEPSDRQGSTLNVAALAALPDAVRRRVLRLAAVRAGARAGSLSREHVLALDALVTDWRGQGPLHLPGVRAARQPGAGTLQICRPA